MKFSLLKVGTVTILASSLFTGVAFAETETTSSESVSCNQCYLKILLFRIAMKC